MTPLPPRIARADAAAAPTARHAPAGPVRIPALALAVALSWALAGCATSGENVYFFTKTSTSLVEADSTPASFSIGYDRAEGYAGPRFADGSVFPVASSIESNGRRIDREVRQVFAAGNAALIATAPRAGGAAAETAGSTRSPGAPGRPGAARLPAVASAAAAEPPAQERRKTMFYATGTSIGLKLGFLEGALLPGSFNLGYKRKEVAVIPVAAGALGTSALGTFSNGVVTALPAGGARAATGFDVQQFFATGGAADHLAQLDSVRSRFTENATQALGGDVERFRNEEARQGRLALDSIACVNKLPDDRLARVWNNLEDLQLFAPLQAVARIRAQADARQQRQAYFETLSLLDPASAELTRGLALHRAAVCRL
jgi:hypothetical protein